MKKLFVVFFSWLFIIGCNDRPVTTADICRLNDTIPPELTINTPADNDFYGSTVLVSGKVIDYCNINKDPGQIISLSYKINDVIKGNIDLNTIQTDGSFTFTFNTTNLENTQTLTIIAVDSNYHKTELLLTLHKGAFPSFTCEPGNGSVTLTWDPVVGADNYKISYAQYADDYRNVPAGFEPSVVINDVSSGYIIGELNNGYLYGLRVDSYAGTEKTNSSDVIYAIPLSTLTLIPVVLPQYNKLKIQWNPIPGARYFNVFRAQAWDSGFDLIASLVNSNSYSDTSVEPNQSYYYKIVPALEGSRQSCSQAARPSPFAPMGELAGFSEDAQNAIGITVENNIACVTNGSSGIDFFDISDPASPVLLSHYSYTGTVVNAAISADKAFIGAQDKGVLILDISDINSPELLGSYDTTSYTFDAAVSGNYLFVADDADGLVVLDISDPANPAYAGEYTSLTNARALDISGNYLYIADGESGLVILDITAPASPAYVSTYNTPNWANDVVVQNNTAYVADKTSGLQAINVLVPGSPVLLGSYDTAGTALSVSVNNNYACIADDTNGIVLVNISKPSSPQWIKTDNTIIKALSTVIDNGYAFTACGTGGLCILNIKDTSGLAPLPLYAPGNVYDIAIRGDYAFLVIPGTGMQIIDIHDPSTITVTGSVGETTPTFQNVTIHGSYAFITGSNAGITVYNIENPFSPFFVCDKMITGYQTTGCAVQGDYLFLTFYDNGIKTGVRIYDISKIDSQLDPALMIVEKTTSLTQCNLTDFANSIKIAGNYAYVADNTAGLQVIDITDKSNPILTGTCNAINTALDLEIGETNLFNQSITNKLFAYVADQSSGIKVIDLTDPASPALVNSWQSAQIANYNGVCLNSRFLFIAQGNKDLVVADVFNPDNIYNAGLYNFTASSNETRKAEATGNFVFLALGADGLGIINLLP